MDSFCPQEFYYQLVRQAYNEYNKRQKEKSTTNGGISNMVWGAEQADVCFRTSQMSNLLPVLYTKTAACDLKTSTFKLHCQFREQKEEKY